MEAPREVGMVNMRMKKHNTVGETFRRLLGVFRRDSIVLENLSLASCHLDFAKHSEAALYAPKLFEESSMLFRSAAEYFNKSKFREAKWLSIIAVEKAQEMVREVERVKTLRKSQIRSALQQAQKRLEMAKRKFGFTRTGEGIDERSKRLALDASVELADTLSFLEAGELNSCEAHLSYANALIDRFLTESQSAALIDSTYVEVADNITNGMFPNEDFAARVLKAKVKE